MNWSRVAIVTGADAGFVRLAEGLLRSLRDAEPTLGQPLRLFVLDFGLDEAGRARLGALADLVPLGSPPFPVPDMPGRRPFFLSRMSKAFLPDLVPGFRGYLWVDADIWLQVPRALDEVLRPLRNHEFAAVPELDRAYRVLFEPVTRQSQIRERRLVRNFGQEAALQLLRMPNVNSGLVAARDKAAVWNVWRERMRAEFANPDDLAAISDQAALNAAIHIDRVPFYPLQAVLNWCFGGSVPRVDADGHLVTPLHPFQPIGLCHLTGVGLTGPVPIWTTDGRTLQLSVDYPSMKAWRATLPGRRGAASQPGAHTPS